MKATMKTVPLEKGYYYLPENNLLINQETLKKFDNYINNEKIILNEINVDKDFLRKKLKDINKIILGITEDCNCRCSYCVYNDNYLYEKKFTRRHLDFETAKKGLEYIYRYIEDRFNKRFNISIYGGEPFIKFEMMKKIVSYSKALFKDWQLIFSVTTNATLLKDEIIDYLIAEDFRILISLDGPPINHNSKRVYKNGKGTFKAVWKALERIKKKDAGFFNKNISFNIVHSFDLSLADVFRFYTENELINKNRVTYNQVVVRHTDYYEKIDYNEASVINDFQLIFKNILAKCKESTKLNPSEKDIYQRYFVNKIFNLKPGNIFSGTCFFNTRVFIDVEGKFHLCESINNKFPYGDVWKGFDFDRMVEMVKEFANIKKKYCSDCDIKYLCKPCYVIFASNGTLDLDKDFCSYHKKSKIMDLRRQIRFEEEKTTINEQDKSKIFRFHQFIRVEKGPVNTAIVDFIKGDIYHVPTKIIEHFDNAEYEKIPGFIKDAKESGLVIYVNRNTWIPVQNISKEDLEYFDEIGRDKIVLCVEDGVDLALLKHRVSNFNITRIIYYGSGSQRIAYLFPGVDILYETPDYLKCSTLCIIEKNDFAKIDEGFYNFSKGCNNCWGHKISITKDGKIRPCIHSNIVIDDLKNLTNSKTIEKIQSFWYITKDKVEKCKRCELRYFCIDCREIAQRENNGNLYAPNPNCKYNPNTGAWQ